MIGLFFSIQTYLLLFLTCLDSSIYSWIIGPPNTYSSRVHNRVSSPRIFRRAESSPGLISSLSSTLSNTIPRISAEQIQQLAERKYTIIPNFIPPNLVASLADDIRTLREPRGSNDDSSCFKVAKIGQDATNTLNTDIRVAETCFIQDTLARKAPNEARTQLRKIVDQLRVDLSGGPGVAGSTPLDATLSELLYAYYPQGGYYRRHVDAVPGSASVLRKVSLLLYLNAPTNADKDATNNDTAAWTAADGGALRLHFDSGRDERPPGDAPDFVDVLPTGGTLVLMQSDAVPHEVLDTERERMVVVGWYNRPVTINDIAAIGGDGSGGAMSPASPIRLAMLGVAGILVAVGVAGILSS